MWTADMSLMFIISHKFKKNIYGPHVLLIIKVNFREILQFDVGTNRSVCSFLVSGRWSHLERSLTLTGVLVLDVSFTVGGF